jgi:hypothetical protein
MLWLHENAGWWKRNQWIRWYLQRWLKEIHMWQECNYMHWSLGTPYSGKNNFRGRFFEQKIIKHLAGLRQAPAADCSMMRSSNRWAASHKRRQLASHLVLKTKTVLRGRRKKKDTILGSMDSMVKIINTTTKSDIMGTN